MKTLLRVAVRLMLLLGLLQLGTAIEVHPQPGPVPELECNPQPVPLDLSDRPSVRELGRRQIICCPKGHVATAQGDCVAAPVSCLPGYIPTADGDCVDPCAQCDAQVRECRNKVNQGISDCKDDKRKYATDICGNLLNQCNGNPIFMLEGRPPVVCQGELTVVSSSTPGGQIYCDGKLAGYTSGPTIVCHEELKEGQAWVDFPRCIHLKIDHCIDKCLLTDAGGNKTLSGSVYGFSAGISYTIPPNMGYNAGCIALGAQAFDECASEERKCQEACRPSGPPTLKGPGPPTITPGLP